MRRAGSLFVIALVATICIPPVVAQPPPRSVVVNEILYDPADGGSEFVELLNPSEETVTLTDLRLADARQDPVTVSGDPVTIPAGGFLVLVQDSADFAAQFPGVDATEPNGWPQLNNGGDAVIVSADGTTLDSVRYDPDWGGSGGVSLERIDPAAASNDAGNFASSTAERGGTPGAANSVFAPDETPPRLVSVRASAGGDTLRALFSEPLDATTVQPSDFSVEGAQIVNAETRRDTVILMLNPALNAGEYLLAARDVADRAGNVQPRTEQAFTFVRGAAPDERDIVVNEIFYDPPDEDQEFVEILNVSEKTFDLQDFALADDRDEPVPLSDTTAPLPPGGYAVLARDAGAFAAAFPNARALEVANWPALNNGGDRPALYYRQALIDSVPYDPSWGGSDGMTSLERIDPAGPSGNAVNFGSSEAPRGGTPGTQNSLFAPDADAPQPVFAEQRDDRTLRVTFDEPLDPASVAASDFRLGGSAPRSASLMNAQTVALLHFDAAITTPTLTVSDVRDLTGNTLSSADAPVAFRPAPGQVVVNEILAAPRNADDDNLPNQPEFIELLNRTDRLLALSASHFTDAPDEDGAADTVRFAAAHDTERAALAPGSRAVVFAAPGDPANPATDSDLARSFPNADFSRSGLTLLPVDAASLGLSNSSDLVALHRRGGELLDSVAYASDWANPLRGKRGVSLERIRPGGASNSALNWAGSVAKSGATPGAANSVPFDPDAGAPNPGDLVVNEILFAPRNADDDDLPDQPEFIELRNTSERVLELDGLFVTDRPDEDGDADTLRLAFAPEALAPGSLAVAFQPPGAIDSAAAALTAAFPDAGTRHLLPVPQSLSLSNSEDLIALHGPSGATLDSVAYDDGWHRSDLDDARGVSLERIREGGPSSDAANWTSSVAEAGATPGRPNSVATPEDGSNPPREPGLRVEPSPFSPDGDGFEDTAVIRYALERAAASIRVRIYDQTGRLVRTLRRADLSSRMGAVNWNGRDDEDNELRLGIYVVVLDAVDADSGHAAAYKETVVLARPLD